MQIDLAAFNDQYKKEYAFLYENGDHVAGYAEAVAAFDSDIKAAPRFKDLVRDFVLYRGDFISSDREAAAFEYACEALDLFGYLLA